MFFTGMSNRGPKKLMAWKFHLVNWENVSKPKLGGLGIRKAALTNKHGQLATMGKLHRLLHSETNSSFGNLGEKRKERGMVSRLLVWIDKI